MLPHSYLHKGIQCVIEWAHSPVKLPVLSRQFPVLNTCLISRGREGEREGGRERGREGGREGGRVEREGEVRRKEGVMTSTLH